MAKISNSNGNTGKAWRRVMKYQIAYLTVILTVLIFYMV